MTKMTRNDKVPELTNGEFENFIKEGTVFIDFFAEWCMPCVMMGPIVDELAEKFKGKIKFGKVNIEDNHTIAQKFNVRSIPHFIIFKEGNQEENFTGAISSEEFEEKLNKLLK
ncbi:MAG: thioredoxin [archaeon]